MEDCSSLRFGNLLIGQDERKLETFVLWEISPRSGKCTTDRDLRFWKQLPCKDAGELSTGILNEAYGQGVL